MILDITNKPRFLRKFKTQPGFNEPLEKSKLFKVNFKILKAHNLYLTISTGIRNSVV